MVPSAPPAKISDEELPQTHKKSVVVPVVKLLQALPS